MHTICSEGLSVHYKCFGISIQIAAGWFGHLFCRAARHCCYWRVMAPKGKALCSPLGTVKGEDIPGHGILLLSPSKNATQQKSYMAMLSPCPRGEHRAQITPEKCHRQGHSVGVRTIYYMDFEHALHYQFWWKRYSSALNHPLSRDKGPYLKDNL